MAGKRTKIIAGNWKMNKTPGETKIFLEELKTKIEKDAVCDVVVIPPLVDIPVAAETLRGTNIKVGAQNCYFEENGAFTGEVSTGMLKDLGVEYVIAGHSERRTLFGETNEIVNKKVKAILNSGMKVIFCLGETLEEREAGRDKAVVKEQFETGLLDVATLQDVVIAYEPVWAIGTGKTATAEQANEMCGYIRDLLVDMFADESEAVQIQYGGSMNAKNAEELLAQEEIDGGLIGSASLKTEDFTKIVESCKE